MSGICSTAWHISVLKGDTGSLSSQLKEPDKLIPTCFLLKPVLLPILIQIQAFLQDIL